MEDTRTSNPGVRSVNPAAVASAPTAPLALQSRRAAGTPSGRLGWLIADARIEQAAE